MSLFGIVLDSVWVCYQCCPVAVAESSQRLCVQKADLWNAAGHVSHPDACVECWLLPCSLELELNQRTRLVEEQRRLQARPHPTPSCTCSYFYALDSQAQTPKPQGWLHHKVLSARAHVDHPQGSPHTRVTAG